MRDRLNPDDLDDEDPFEVDQAGNEPHLFAHSHYSTADLKDVYASDPLFAPASEDGPADWLMIGDAPGEGPLVVPLMPPRRPNPRKARPIGIYPATGDNLVQYREWRANPRDRRGERDAEQWNV